MLSQKTKQTNKKFYGKWLYKVSFLFEGCALLRSKSFDELEHFCNGPDPDSYRHSLSQRAWNNRENLLKLCVAIKPYTRDIYNLRIEGNILDVYTNDESFYIHTSTELEEFVRVRFKTPNGEILTKQFVGMTARCFQHEYDHLDGIRFYDRANKFHKDQAMRKWKNHG